MAHQHKTRRVISDLEIGVEEQQNSGLIDGYTGLEYVNLGEIWRFNDKVEMEYANIAVLLPSWLTQSILCAHIVREPCNPICRSRWDCFEENNVVPQLEEQLQLCGQGLHYTNAFSKPSKKLLLPENKVNCIQVSPL